MGKAGCKSYVAYIKNKAGIEKAGGVHVFSRHTAATILVANGCDIRPVKELLRQKILEPNSDMLMWLIRL